MPAPFPITDSESVGSTHEYLATPTAVDLTTRPGKPQRCARRIVAMAAGNWTLLADSGGVDSPPGAVFQGFLHDSNTSAITSTAGVMVYW